MKMVIKITMTMTNEKNKERNISIENLPDTETYKTQHQ